MIDGVIFNLKEVYTTDILYDMGATLERFTKAHNGEMWSSTLICLLCDELELVANKYGYKFVGTIDKCILYVKVVRG